jgi:hypothetical protein
VLSCLKLNICSRPVVLGTGEAVYFRFNLRHFLQDRHFTYQSCTKRRWCKGNHNSVMSKDWLHDYRHLRTSVRQIGFGGSMCLPNLYDKVDDRNLPTIWVT